ncbi:MAG TPA: 2'-5' RNA ligase family protein [Acidimicrobiales bacterium]
MRRKRDGTPHLSCWALPTAATQGWFQEAIERFARISGTRAFVPHVTVLGDVSGWTHERVAAVLKDVPSFEVEMLQVDDEDARFRCVTLRASPDPLVRLRAQLRSAMQSDDTEPYRPHLSLLYGERTTSQRREAIEAAGLPASLPAATIGAVAVWDTSDLDWGSWRELDRWTL